MSTNESLPWQEFAGDNFAACNFAFANLMINIKHRLTVNGHIHAETLLSAIGLIAGHAAQRTLLEQLAGLTPEDRGKPENHLLFVDHADAHRRYVFGDSLNGTLFHDPARDKRLDFKLVPVVYSYALAAGAAEADLMPLEAIFRHISATIGRPEEGMTILGQAHQPHLPMFDLLRLVWPLAVSCFTGTIMGPDGPPQSMRVVEMRWRPVIAAACTGRLLYQVKDVLDPALGYALLMESAIYGSKPIAAHIDQSDDAPS